MTGGLASKGQGAEWQACKGWPRTKRLLAFGAELWPAAGLNAAEEGPALGDVP